MGARCPGGTVEHHLPVGHFPERRVAQRHQVAFHAGQREAEEELDEPSLRIHDKAPEVVAAGFSLRLAEPQAEVCGYNRFTAAL